MDDLSRRHAIKLLATIIGVSALPSCSCLAGRNSNCKNYQFEHITNPVIDMHAHFFNASDLMVVEYILGPGLNDFIGDRFIFIRGLLVRVANAILKLEKFRRGQIRARSELAWLQSENACNPSEEYAKVSEEFFELILEEDSEKSLSFTDDPTNLPFEELLARAAGESNETREKGLTPGIRNNQPVSFDKNTVLRAVGGDVSRELGSYREGDLTCPSDPGVVTRILAFAARALVRRSTNVQAYYDRYSLNPIDGYGVRHVMNISCDFDFFLGCPNYESSIEDQIKVHEEIWRHTSGYAIPVLGVNPWKMYHDKSYEKFVESTLDRGIFKGLKLYPSIGYSVTGEIRDGVRGRTCSGFGVSEDIVKSGMDSIIRIADEYGAYITSHTTFSKGAEPGAEALASSIYWEERLNKRPNLKVNFGHMGDPSSNGGTEWREGFLSLMRRYENVHADFGYHEYSDYNTVKSDLESFKRNHGEEIFKKISYGSDWYMISKDDGANAYLCTATQNFEKAVSDGVISEEQLKDMFYNNAHGFLGLEDG